MVLRDAGIEEDARRDRHNIVCGTAQFNYENTKEWGASIGIIPS